MLQILYNDPFVYDFLPIYTMDSGLGYRKIESEHKQDLALFMIFENGITEAIFWWKFGRYAVFEGNKKQLNGRN